MFNLWPKSMPEPESLFKKKKLDSTLRFEMHWQREWDKFMNEINDSVIDMIRHIDSKTQDLFFDLIKIFLLTSYLLKLDSDFSLLHLVNLL